MADNKIQNSGESEQLSESAEATDHIVMEVVEPIQPTTGFEPEAAKQFEDSGHESPDTNFNPQHARPLLAANAPSANSAVVQKKSSKLRRLAIVVVVMINVAMAGGSGYLFSLTKKSAASSAQAGVYANTGSGQNQSNDKTTAKPEEPKTVHYKSDPLKLEFDYPGDWRIESDPGNKNIQLSSPVIKINQADGSSTQAKVVIVLDEKYPGQLPYIVDNEARIVDSSQAITYSDPTAVQRKETNLSFSKVSSAKVLKDSGISSLFISGNFAYKKGEAVSSKKYITINPFISAYASTCFDTSCNLFSAAEITPDTYQNNPTFQQVKAIIASSRFN